MKRTFITFILIGSLLMITACQKEETLVIGFFPAKDAGEIVDTVKPLADRLSEELGIKVKGTVMTSYNALVDAMGANQIQIGFIPAFGYVLANEEYDVEVILKSVRRGEGSYKAQYVVRTESDSEELSDLEEDIWAFPDKASTSGYLFPAKQLMTELDIDSVNELEDGFFDQVIETGTHEAAAISVLEGDADVATTHSHVLDNLSEDYPDIKEHLKVIGYTDDIPNDTISVVDDLDPDLKEEIKQAFLKFNEDEDMIEIMNTVYTWDGITEADADEYEFVRETYHQFRNIIE